MACKSGIQARTYTKRSAGTGNWSSVGLVAGDGCRFLILLNVGFFVFVIGPGALSQNSG